ncbi:MAG: peptidoglycan bridge formation glycyltransferase FemA/FemB family protein, partial [bacterium]|nr:peptidoglycan bridge formation glycyltransferase FemA/FemB family protein [bacterium]
MDITSEVRKKEYNQRITHPLQAYEWGEFREKTGIKVIRRGFAPSGKASGQEKIVDGFQVTIHPIPHTPFFAGYLPKGTMPTDEMIDELKKIGKEERCIFIQLEPNIIHSQNTKYEILNTQFVPAHHPLFTKYTLVLDLTKSEEELLKNMHSKTRYNIRVAEKHGVIVKEDDSEIAFERYVQLTRETTTRQGFFAHNEKYHRLMWNTLRWQIANGKPASPAGRSQIDREKLTARLLTATYQGKILVTWIIFIFHDTIYYPYGASSNEHREVMASTLMMWETIRWGKKMGLKKFDMWG